MGPPAAGETSPSQDDTTTNDQTTENPFASSFAFQLTVPPIEVEMVNASGLSDYEVWLFVASLVFSFTVGFFVAYAQSFHTVGTRQESDRTFLVVAILFLILFFVFFGRALTIRWRLRKNARTYKMSATNVVD
jgi:membrane protein DedA with SNARE-associated domain